MAQTKTEKRNQAKKVAEQSAAKKKAIRAGKGNIAATANPKAKGKSAVPQTKKK
ncbi:hypothetical protein [Portibacter lacus]|uniref:Uncharacterized protein n=1 Tax=Portibacter lacus TaxID=1099794 RepID=A0AA37SL55_9BACT|nr:hypothetical protein [Portibacter lacus]GLR15589.1 hypothetical protein GCM10007940_02040 [Portibacter lacus]